MRWSTFGLVLAQVAVAAGMALFCYSWGRNIKRDADVADIAALRRSGLSVPETPRLLCVVVVPRSFLVGQGGAVPARRMAQEALDAAARARDLILVEESILAEGTRPVRGGDLSGMVAVEYSALARPVSDAKEILQDLDLDEPA